MEFSFVSTRYWHRNTQKIDARWFRCVQSTMGTERVPQNLSSLNYFRWESSHAPTSRKTDRSWAMFYFPIVFFQIARLLGTAGNIENTLNPSVKVYVLEMHPHPRWSLLPLATGPEPDRWSSNWLFSPSRSVGHSDKNHPTQRCGGSTSQTEISHNMLDPCMNIQFLIPRSEGGGFPRIVSFQKFISLSFPGIQWSSSLNLGNAFLHMELMG